MNPWHWLSWCPQVGFEGLDSVSWQFSSAICQRAWDSLCICGWLTTMAPLSHTCCAQAPSRVTVPLSLSRCESISPPKSELAVWFALTNRRWQKGHIQSQEYSQLLLLHRRPPCLACAGWKRTEVPQPVPSTCVGIPSGTYLLRWPRRNQQRTHPVTPQNCEK